ncbi:MAG: BtpA/SgcQ family protein [Kiritimatiellia bacterium]
MKKTLSFFEKSNGIIAMVHVRALPGTPKHESGIQRIIDTALEEAGIYAREGIEMLLLENMHDVPYLNRSVGPEVTASMTAVAQAVKKEFPNKVCGIQILAGANCEALAVAHATKLDFIRAEGFVFAHTADEGIMNADAGRLLRYRSQIGAGNIKVFTDIKKKHSAHSLTADVSIAETASAAEYFLSDGVVVTGRSTGCPADIEELRAVRNAVDIPVLIGSGVTADNVAGYFPLADALIVGSWFKKGGHWANAIDPARVARFMEKVNGIRDITGGKE